MPHPYHTILILNYNNIYNADNRYWIIKIISSIKSKALSQFFLTDSVFIIQYFPFSLIMSVLFSILVLFSSCLLSIAGRFYQDFLIYCPVTGISEVTELCHCYQYNFSTTLHTSIVLLDTSLINKCNCETNCFTHLQ